jgi:fructose-bisphosphate aldolase/6-deoxy-5-ketofructose 1-phosphate synthase
MASSSTNVNVPADVPREMRAEYVKNYSAITRKSGRLMLFAGDQKIEHLNDDFYGPGISEDDSNPEHLFRIASRAEIGAFATQMGLIALYGEDHPNINYLVKLNSKTNLVKTEQAEPYSGMLYSVDQVVEFKDNTGLNIPAVGYTIYTGSEHEAEMLYEAAQMILAGHQHGMVTVIWMYPRGKAVKDERDPHLIAGAAGLASCLGADFVKVNYPKKPGLDAKESFKEAINAAGRCKVICAGGSSMDVRAFLERLHDQIFVSGASGNATGRNIHQKPLHDAIRMCNAISAITIKGLSVTEAMAIYEGTKDFKL